MADTVEQAIYRLRVEGEEEVDAAAASVDGLAAAEGRLFVSEEKVNRATRTRADSMDRMLGRLDPRVRAEQQLAATLAQLNRFEEEGIGTVAQRGQAMAAATQRYADAMQRIKGTKAEGTFLGAADAMKLSTFQMQNMAFQLNDIGVMLASGQSPFVLLMQQGMQISQIFGPGVGVAAAMKATGAALVSFITNPLTLTVIGIAAAAGAVSLLWGAVSDSDDADDALEQHKKLIDDIRDAYGDAGDAATRYAAKSAEVLKFRTASTLSSEMKALNSALQDFTLSNTPGEILNPSQVAADFGPLNAMVTEFVATIHDGTADVAAFERALAAIGNATDDVETDAAVAEVLALIDPLLELERQARQTAGATQLFVGTLVQLGRAGMLRFADAFGNMNDLRDDLTGFLDEQNRAAKEAAETAAERAEAIRKVIDGLRFEEEQLNRTAREQEIYNALRQAGTTLDSAAGQEIASLAGSLYDATAAQKAFNDLLKEAKSSAEGFAGTLVSGLIKGGSLIDSLGSAVGGLSSKLGNFAGGLVEKFAGGGLFGSILSGLGGGLISGLVQSIGGIIDSIFGNAEEEALRKKEEKEARIARREAREERLEQQEERRLSRREARARQREGYADRQFFAGLDTSSLEGQLAQFDREAMREREEEIRNGGRSLAQLDAALYAERMALLQDYNAQALAEQQAAQEAALATARDNLRQAYEAERDVLEQVRDRALAFADSMRDLRDSIRLDQSVSTLSPVDRLTEARRQFDATSGMAMSGDEAARGRVTGSAQSYLTEARSFYASSPEYAAIFGQVDTLLSQLGVSATDQASIADQQLAALNTQVGALIDINNSVMSVVEAIAALQEAMGLGPKAALAAARAQIEAANQNNAELKAEIKELKRTISVEFSRPAQPGMKAA